jgi:catechol 2,3-dioxygenase-like lactoylglutathione lyase family enzyme
MLRVGGVLETALYVKNLERSLQFYKAVFDFAVIASEERICALQVADRQVLLLIKEGASVRPRATPGGTVPGTDGSGNLHLAFWVSASELEEWERWLRERGVAIESKVTREKSGESFWLQASQSLYFRDPDGHVLELKTV